MKKDNTVLSMVDPSTDQINLSSINEKTKWRIRFAFIGFVLTYAAACFLIGGRSITTLVLLSFSILFVFLFLRSYKSLSSATIKGDTLILKNTENRASVTHIKSIRNVRTKKLGSTAITSLKYKLDGIQHRALLVSDIDEHEVPQLMIQRIQKELKKKKANL